MKTIALALLASTLATSVAMAEDGPRAADHAQWIFPPITQTMGYTYSQPLTMPRTSPAKGNLALATAPITPPITETLGATHSRPMVVATHQ